MKTPPAQPPQATTPVDPLIEILRRHMHLVTLVTDAAAEAAEQRKILKELVTCVCDLKLFVDKLKREIQK